MNKTSTNKKNKEHLTKYLVVVILVLGLSIVYLVPSEANGVCNGKVLSSRRGLIELLRYRGFSGAIDEYVDLKRLGQISVGRSCFIIFLYQLERSNARYTALLLVFKDDDYLGSYVLDAMNLPTQVKGNRVEFPGMEKSRNVIIFSERGAAKRGVVARRNEAV